MDLILHTLIPAHPITGKLLQVESGRHTAVALIIQAAKYRYLGNKIVTTREGNNMRRKLTALMALLMLAGAGMIAPTATAQEYEGSYVTRFLATAQSRNSLPLWE